MRRQVESTLDSQKMGNKIGVFLPRRAADRSWYAKVVSALACLVIAEVFSVSDQETVLRCAVLAEPNFIKL